jgi:hypothetical protein
MNMKPAIKNAMSKQSSLHKLLSVVNESRIYTKSIAFILSLFLFATVNSQVNFEKTFKNKTLRVDLTLQGDSSQSFCAVQRVLQEPFWGGRVNNLDTMIDRGTFCMRVFDSESKKLIYTEGFCTLFDEWQTTPEATYLTRSFEQTLRIPMPKKEIILEIWEREEGKFKTKVLSSRINPNSQLVQPAEKQQASTRDIEINGKPGECIDIVIIAEGYGSKESSLFYDDAQHFSERLFTSAPFKLNRSKINLRAVMTYSENTGADDPGAGVFISTALDASYNTFYSDRYLMTKSVHKVSDYAGLVPYDVIIILVNTDKYGGGGIYNYYSINSARGSQKGEVFIHELGHSFAGLADEYYTSEVSYVNYYPLHIEPWEPNITTRVNFSKKWPDMMDDETPVPTPNKLKFSNVTGLFEGGGYTAKGVFRPAYDCRMKTNEAEDFCPVCIRAIQQTIDFYTKSKN